MRRNNYARERQKKIAQEMGLPKGLIQFAARHGKLPEDIRNERLKYPELMIAKECRARVHPEATS